MRNHSRKWAYCMAAPLFPALLCLGLCWSTAIFSQPEPAPKNLITNPGFEEVDKAKQAPKAWRIADWNPKDQKGTVKIEVSDQARSGKVAAGIKKTGGPNIVIIQRVAAKITGRRTFELKFFYKLPGSGIVSASVTTGNAASKKSLQYDHSSKYRFKEDWAEAVFEFVTHPDTEFITIYLRTNKDGTLFDDVSLIEK